MAAERQTALCGATAALTGLLLATAAAGQLVDPAADADPDYHFLKAIPQVLGDPVPGLWRHEVSSVVGGRRFAPQRTDMCLSAGAQQQFVDTVFEAFSVPLFGGCYGSMYLDTPDELHVIEHCDATRAVNELPAFAGFHSTLRIHRVRAPQDSRVLRCIRSLPGWARARQVRIDG